MGALPLAFPKIRPLKKTVVKLVAPKIRVGLVKSRSYSFSQLHGIDDCIVVDITSELDFERVLRNESVDIFFIEDTIEWMDLFCSISLGAKQRNVVLLTNLKKPELIQAAFRSGISDVLELPEDSSEISKILRVLTQIRG